MIFKIVPRHSIEWDHRKATGSHPMVDIGLAVSVTTIRKHRWWSVVDVHRCPQRWPRNDVSDQVTLCIIQKSRSLSGGPLKKTANNKYRSTTSFLHDSYAPYARKPVQSTGTQKAPTRVSEPISAEKPRTSGSLPGSSDAQTYRTTGNGARRLPRRERAAQSTFICHR